jgi:hypothetical protein
VTTVVFLFIVVVFVDFSTRFRSSLLPVFSVVLGLVVRSVTFCVFHLVLVCLVL